MPAGRDAQIRACQAKRENRAPQFWSGPCYEPCGITRIEFVAEVATSTVITPTQPQGAAPAARRDSAGDIFAQLLAALGQPSADLDVSALPATVEPKNANASPAKPADHPANDPPCKTLQNLLAQLHATSKANKPGEIVSDAAKVLTKTSSTAGTRADGTPADGTPPPDPDRDIPGKEPKPAADANTLLAQLLAVAQPPQSAPRPVQAPLSDVEQPNTNLPVATPVNHMLAAPADVVASGIGQSGTQSKTPRDPKRDETTANPDSVKSQSSSAKALAGLSTAVGHAIRDGQPATPSGHPNADGNNSTVQPNSPHPSAPVSEVRAAPQATSATSVPPAISPPPPQSDSNALAAANGSVPSAQPPGAPPVQLHTGLQVGAAPTHAVPDIGALAVTIATRSQNGIKHFDIRLDPPELGKVDVRLTVDDAGRAQASLAVEKPQTLELLQRDSSSLERALKNAGLDLSQNGLNFSLKGQHQQQAGDDNSPTPRGRALHVRATLAIEQSSPTLSSSGAAGEPRLDIRV